jgi:hypothetical protein
MRPSDVLDAVIKRELPLRCRTLVVQSAKCHIADCSILLCLKTVNTLKHEINAYSVLTAKKQRVSISKINWLILFREIISVYSENHTKPIRIL